MNPITTIQQLKVLQERTMIYAVCVCIIAFFISFVVSNMFPYEGKDDRSYIKRRIAYIVIGLISSLGFWIYNDSFVSSYIKNSGLQSMFSTTNIECLVITILGYLIVGIFIMFIFRNTKYGSILGNLNRK